MEFMMFVATDSDAEPYPQGEDNTIKEWLADVDASGVRIRGQRLRPVEDATTVRLRNGQRLVTDGPYAEAKEWIAGYDILECADLDEAIKIASKHPMARYGQIELRPAWPLDF